MVYRRFFEKYSGIRTPRSWHHLYRDKINFSSSQFKREGIKGGFMTQKKKIIHIIQSLENGGCENMLLRTLPLLQDFEHKIITLKKFGELTPKFVPSGITIETIP